jgi:hypothetical protein
MKPKVLLGWVLGALLLPGGVMGAAWAQSRSGLGMVTSQPAGISVGGLTFRVPWRFQVKSLYELPRGTALEYRDEETGCTGQVVFRTTLDETQHATLVQKVLDDIEGRARTAKVALSRSNGTTEIFGHPVSQVRFVFGAEGIEHLALVYHRLEPRRLSLVGTTSCRTPEAVDEAMKAVIGFFETKTAGHL